MNSNVNGVIDQSQYSHLVATVIGSAVIPTAIANRYFMPKHLLPGKAEKTIASPELAARRSEEVG